MNGVTIPGVSAGSNHVGASEMWTHQVTWPSGAAAAGTAATAEISRTRTATERRGLIMSLLQCRPAPPGVGAGAGKYSATGISITLGPFDARASFTASAISSGRSTYDAEGVLNPFRAQRFEDGLAGFHRRLLACHWRFAVRPEVEVNVADERPGYQITSGAASPERRPGYRRGSQA